MILNNSFFLNICIGEYIDLLKLHIQHNTCLYSGNINKYDSFFSLY